MIRWPQPTRCELFGHLQVTADNTCATCGQPWPLIEGHTLALTRLGTAHCVQCSEHHDLVPWPCPTVLNGTW